MKTTLDSLESQYDFYNVFLFNVDLLDTAQKKVVKLIALKKQ